MPSCCTPETSSSLNVDFECLPDAGGVSAPCCRKANCNAMQRDTACGVNGVNKSSAYREPPNCQKGENYYKKNADFNRSGHKYKQTQSP